jgi:zinc transporter, ZIP family
VRRAATAVTVAIAAAGIAVAFAAPWHQERSSDSEMKVSHVALRPGHIRLVVVNGGEERARVAQVILNDAFVDFRATWRALLPGDAETIVVAYPWIRGESYEIRLMTSTGRTVEYEIEEAS